MDRNLTIFADGDAREVLGTLITPVGYKRLDAEGNNVFLTQFLVEIISSTQANTIYRIPVNFLVCTQDDLSPRDVVIQLSSLMDDYRRRPSDFYNMAYNICRRELLFVYDTITKDRMTSDMAFMYLESVVDSMEKMHSIDGVELDMLVDKFSRHINRGELPSEVWRLSQMREQTERSNQ